MESTEGHSGGRFTKLLHTAPGAAVRSNQLAFTSDSGLCIDDADKRHVYHTLACISTSSVHRLTNRGSPANGYIQERTIECSAHAFGGTYNYFFLASEAVP